MRENKGYRGLGLLLGLLGLAALGLGGGSGHAQTAAPDRVTLAPPAAPPAATAEVWWRRVLDQHTPGPGGPDPAPPVDGIPAAPVLCGVVPPWQAGPQQTPARWAPAGASGPDGALYVAGGIDGAYHPLAATSRFNPATSAWEPLAPLPLPVGQAGAAWVGNRLYLAGGYRGTGNQVTNSLQIYDAASNSWSSGAAVPTANGLEGAAAAGMNGNMYVFGGDKGPPPALSSLFIYNTATNTWSNGAPLPAARTAGAAVATGGLIYYFGGFDASFNAVDTLWAYDPAANHWTALASANAGGHGGYASMSLYEPGKLLVTNGATTNLSPSSGTEIYDIAANSWSAGPALLNALFGTAQGTLADGRVVVYSGLNGNLYSDVTATSEVLPPVAACTTPTSTPAPPSPTPGPPTATPTPCGGFSDVHPADYFYTAVQYLVGHGVISGYGDCTFRPYNQTTRSQMVKIVVLGFNIPIATPAPGAYTFTDVPPAFPFFAYVETAAVHQIVSGYACGGPGEPCDPQSRPYFRPYANVTRGQLAKITTVGANWPLINPAAPGTFADVLPGSPFYTFVETAACHGVISGYACGGPGEPCDPQSRPYFRQSANAIRGQIAKIEYGAISGGAVCATPTAVR